MRVHIAQSLALAGLASAVVATLGPADTIRSAYSWPGEALPAKTRAAGGIGRFLVSSTEGASDAIRPVTVLAKIRHPQRTRTLTVTRVSRIASSSESVTRPQSTRMAGIPRSQPLTTCADRTSRRRPRGLPAKIE
jgi:hypothetical protein